MILFCVFIFSNFSIMRELKVKCAASLAAGISPLTVPLLCHAISRFPSLSIGVLDLSPPFCPPTRPPHADSNFASFLPYIRNLYIDFVLKCQSISWTDHDKMNLFSDSFSNTLETKFNYFLLIINSELRIILKSKHNHNIFTSITNT